MSALNDAVEALVNHYGSLDAAAQRLIVDAQEVADALEHIDPDTPEFVALSYLAKYNPIATTNTTNKTK